MDFCNCSSVNRAKVASRHHLKKIYDLKALYEVVAMSSVAESAALSSSQIRLCNLSGFLQSSQSLEEVKEINSNWDLNYSWGGFTVVGVLFWFFGCCLFGFLWGLVFFFLRTKNLLLHLKTSFFSQYLS